MKTIILLSMIGYALSQTLCTENPCLNGGTCYVTADGSDFCHCAPGWDGPLCGVPYVSECQDNNECQHGECFENADGKFCHCKEGWTGPNCDVPIPV